MLLLKCHIFYSSTLIIYGDVSQQLILFCFQAIRCHPHLKENGRAGQWFIRKETANHEAAHNFKVQTRKG